MDVSWWQAALFALDFLIKLVMIGVVPGGRKPSSANAWLLLILFVPVIGLPLFLLMGSRIASRRRHRIQVEAKEAVDNIHTDIPDEPGSLSGEASSIVRLNRTLTG